MAVQKWEDEDLHSTLGKSSKSMCSAHSLMFVALVGLVMFMCSAPKEVIETQASVVKGTHCPMQKRRRGIQKYEPHPFVYAR